MIVVDASAIVELLLRLPKASAVQACLADQTRHAPHLLDVEFMHVLRRYRSLLSATRCQEALEDFGALHIQRYSHVPLLPRIWELRENVSAYDAAYVALAETLGAALVTCDARLARAGHRAVVTLV